LLRGRRCPPRAADRELPGRRSSLAQAWGFAPNGGFDTSVGMEALNTMTKIMHNLRTHGGIACLARWALIYRSLRGGRLHATL